MWNCCLGIRYRHSPYNYRLSPCRYRKSQLISLFSLFSYRYFKTVKTVQTLGDDRNCNFIHIMREKTSSKVKVKFSTTWVLSIYSCLLILFLPVNFRKKHHAKISFLYQQQHLLQAYDLFLIIFFHFETRTSLDLFFNIKE